MAIKMRVEKVIQRLFNLANVLAAPSFCTEVYEGMRRGSEEKKYFRGLIYFFHPAVGSLG